MNELQKWLKSGTKPPLRIFGKISPYAVDSNEDKPIIERPDRQGVKRGPYKKTRMRMKF